MQIQVNGAVHELPETSTAAELLARLGLAGQRVAMEINEHILPQSQMPKTLLKPGDRVEIVQAIGGG